MKALMANPILGLLVTVPLLAAVAILEGLTALPSAVDRFSRARKGLLFVVVVLTIPFVAVVLGRFVYLR